MELNRNINILGVFALFADTDNLLWERLIGSTVVHNTIGTGTIEKTSKNMARNVIYIDIRFNGLPESKRQKTFSNESFLRGYFKSVDFDLSLLPGFVKFYETEIEGKKGMDVKIERDRRRAKEREEQLKREGRPLREYNSLKKKYGIGESIHPSIPSPLYVILLKFESGENLDVEDIEWLQNNKLFSILALYYEREYVKTGELWNLVNATSNLRRADNPYKAIELLKDKRSPDSRLMSALLTTSGGAHRDINELSKAEKLAQEAIRINSKGYYPYNLLGAIYYQKGEPEKGDIYFEEAINLGASPRIMDMEIRKSFNKVEMDEKARIAKYLLEKDPKKYQWARFYIDN